MSGTKKKRKPPTVWTKEQNVIMEEEFALSSSSDALRNAEIGRRVNHTTKVI
jgi:hypothetical protein